VFRVGPNWADHGACNRGHGAVQYRHRLPRTLASSSSIPQSVHVRPACVCQQRPARSRASSHGVPIPSIRTRLSVIRRRICRPNDSLVWSALGPRAVERRPHRDRSPGSLGGRWTTTAADSSEEVLGRGWAASQARTTASGERRCEVNPQVPQAVPPIYPSNANPPILAADQRANSDRWA
jgi:hypothetical protein